MKESWKWRSGRDAVTVAAMTLPAARRGEDEIDHACARVAHEVGNDLGRHARLHAPTAVTSARVRRA